VYFTALRALGASSGWTLYGVLRAYSLSLITAGVAEKSGGASICCMQRETSLRRCLHCWTWDVWRTGILLCGTGPCIEMIISNQRT